MTHDELLKKITGVSKGNSKWITNFDDLLTPNAKALRAVVEILKGYNDGQVRVNEEFNQGVLSLSNVIKDTIEKELG